MLIFYLSLHFRQKNHFSVFIWFLNSFHFPSILLWSHSSYLWDLLLFPHPFVSVRFFRLSLEISGQRCDNVLISASNVRINGNPAAQKERTRSPVCGPSVEITKLEFFYRKYLLRLRHHDNRVNTQLTDAPVPFFLYKLKLIYSIYGFLK